MENVQTGETSHAHVMPSTDEEVVGFWEDFESIIRQLMGGTKELDTISIVGMPGLGKTTLAKKLFNHFIDNRDYFDVRAWCSVSKNYNSRRLFHEILKQVVANLDDVKDEDIPDKLRKSLMRKRYLIVLDDIWEIEAWEELQLPFPHGEYGSRILLTTRDEKVACQLKHHSDPYFLRFLTTSESWELIQKKVFQGESCPPELVKVGLQVAKNCKGLPLAIVLVAGIIAKERQVILWTEVANNLSSHVLEEQSMKILESSYEHLADHLKICLLYMGLYPEDYKFLVSDLLRLWIAENFVQNMDTDNMENTSKACLNDLVNRSLVLVSKKRGNGEIKHCTVHDVVREFCLKKLAKENFTQLIVPYNPYQSFDKEEPRLCTYIHDDLVQQWLQRECLLDKIPVLGFKEGKSSAQCNRSLEFIAHPRFCDNWDHKIFSPLLNNLRLIRVLHLLDLSFRSCWVTTIQALTYLRYLAIASEEFDFKWVSHLLDLQTLRVEWKDTTKCIKTSPAIWKMNKLRHVDIQKFSFTWKDNDRAIFEETSVVLPNLRTFGKCKIYLRDMSPEFWWRFPNIEQLNIHFVEPEVEYVPFHLVPTPEIDMPNLEELRLQSLQVGFSHTISTYESVGWGSCVVFPSMLKYLSLDSIIITENVVSSISKLQFLERLKLRRIYFKGEGSPWKPGYKRCWDVSDYKFQALKFLKLKFVLMTEWLSSETSFPVLEKLVIDNCWLREIPSSFADIPTLKLIKLIGCRESLEASALNTKKEVEEITGCDELRVHIVHFTSPE